MRNAVIILALLIAGSGVLWAGTDGLRVITAEGARRLAVEQNPKPLPATILLRDQRGEAFRLGDYQGSHLLVEFIYTRCVTLCTTLGETFEQVSNRLSEDAKGRKVNLLSISFDPRDEVADLQDYARRYKAIPEHWRVARVENPQELKQLLDLFGITVIRDEWGNFVHNSAVHFVNQQGYLDEIVNSSPPSVTLEALWKRF